MENQNLDKGKRIEPKIRVSKDGKWVIMNVPGLEQAIIKPVSYLRAILDSAQKRSSAVSVTHERVVNVG